MGPCFGASVLRMEVAESNFCLQLEFEYQASGPLVQLDLQAKPVLEITQSFDVVFSSDRSVTGLRANLLAKRQVCRF
jgi:hypothetical protein